MSAESLGRHRDGPVRTVIGHELLGGQPELLHALQFQRLDPQPLLRAGELVAVHGVGEFGQFAGQGVVAAADPGKFTVHRVPAFLGAVPLPAGQLHGDVDEPDDLLHGDGDGGGAPGLEPAAAGPFRGFLAGAAFGGGGPFQRGRPVAGGRELFLGAAQGEPGLHLGRAGQRGGQGQGVAVLRGGFLLRGGFGGRGEPCRHRFQGTLFADNLGLGPGQGRGQALTFPDGAAQHRVQVAQAFGDGREFRVGVVEFREGRVRTVLGFGAPGPGGGEGEAVAFEPGGDGGQLRGGVVDGGLDFQQRRRRRGTAGHGQRGKDVPGPGHGGEPGVRGDQLRRGIQILDDGDAGQQGGQRQAGSVRTRSRNQLRGPARARGKRAPPADASADSASANSGEGPAGTSASSSAARPASSSRSSRTAAAAVSWSRTTTASDALPSAAATAASNPASTVIMDAKGPRTPAARTPAAAPSTCPEPSLRFRPSWRASRRAMRAPRSRSPSRSAAFRASISAMTVSRATLAAS